MSADIIFSRRLQRQMHLHRSIGVHFRWVALLLTLGECIACYILFKRMDFIGAYATAAYLAKEHVIARFVRGE